MSNYEIYVPSEKPDTNGKIVFREEQLRAIHDAKAVFNKPFSDRKPFHKYLWNAKMRFGKTLCAMQLAKELEAKRTLIVTHRPVVSEGWKEDFAKIVENDPRWGFGTKFEESQDGDFYAMEKAVKKGGHHYVFFASMQYLRRSSLIKEDGDGDQLKKDLLQNNWDLVVVDEAHEGTLTFLGNRVVTMLSKPKTNVLHLSGTPFNLYEDFGSDEIFTWDYIAEQTRKRNWKDEHGLLPNPYAELPQMVFAHYDLGDLLRNDGFISENAGFMFSEFFRTWKGDAKIDGARMPEGAKGRFVHEDDVKAFLDLLCKKDDANNYPFSTDAYRNGFRHTLWVVPGVEEAKALEGLLRKHRTFGMFKVVNVAGRIEEDDSRNDALANVLEAIGDSPAQRRQEADLPETRRTITLSCGRLTTGTTVRPWTAVLYMKGSENTNVSTYMQTIFRVQTPYHTKDGRMKAKCYVFDFAPDRSLKMLAETARFMAKTNTDRRKITSSAVADARERAALDQLIHFAPVIAAGGQMKVIDTDELIAKLNQAKIDRVVQRGFDDVALYDINALLEYDADAMNGLLGILGKTPGTKEATRIDLAKAGLTGKGKKAKAAKTGEVTEDDGDDTDEVKKAKDAARKERDNRIAILRGVSLRIPLLMFGAEVRDEEKELTLGNFTTLIDNDSWKEFMPRGFTKAEFNKVKSCYNSVVFKDSWRRYRQIAREADRESIETRIKTITTIFSWFHNPDKETVLTPWRVVNMHMSDTIGGYCFYNKKFDGPNVEQTKSGDLVETNEPRFVPREGVTHDIFGQADENGDTPVRVLEINSKTGLYPLYVAYSLYRSILPTWKEKCIDNGEPSLLDEQKLWDKILQENIFVVCNTEMAASITKRTLCGFRKVEGTHIERMDLVEEATTNAEKFAKLLNSEKTWFGKGENEMKFNAVVGNPPYQQMKGEDDNCFASAIYPSFIDIARKLGVNWISLVVPSRWMTKAGQGVSDSWSDEMIHSNNFVQLDDYPDARDCFPNVEIKGGVCYFLFSTKHKGKCRYTIHSKGEVKSATDYLDSFKAGVVIRDLTARSILEKISHVEGADFYNKKSFSELVGPIHLFDKGGVLGSRWSGYSLEKKGKYTVKYYLNKGLLKRGYAWIKESDIPKGHSSIPLHKVYFPEAGGSGIDQKVLGDPFYGEPNSVCSQTYLCIGYNSAGKKLTKTNCLNIISYFKTRFFRYMVSILKRTQHSVATVFQFVPMQDFSQAWDDEKLYKKYKLTKPEIDFIESMIKPME